LAFGFALAVDDAGPVRLAAAAFGFAPAFGFCFVADACVLTLASAVFFFSLVAGVLVSAI